MAISQRQAVYDAVVEVLGNASISFTPKSTNVRSILTTDLRASVIGSVCDKFTNKEVEFKDTDSNTTKLNSQSELKKYVGGLVTNWLNKDPNLNGGSKYETKNPGSKTTSPKVGKAIPQEVKDLRALKDALVASGGDEEKIKEVNEKLQQLSSPTKVEKKEDSLPPDLAELFG